MARAKVVRTDAELECPHLDAGLRERALDLVLLPDGVSEAALAREAMQRLEHEVLARCDELLRGEPVRVRSSDPRLTSQTHGVRFD